MNKVITIFGAIIVSSTLMTSCVSTNQGFQSSPVISRNVQLDPIKVDIIVDEKTKIKGESTSAYFLIFRVSGDNTYASIAAASILAKVTRDEYIIQMCKENPELNTRYDLENNKGYGTKKHMDGIKTHGITQWHRKSFGVCKEFS